MSLELGDISLKALSGTLNLVAGSVMVTGTETRFQKECHIGQFIIALDEGDSVSHLLIIRKIENDIQMVVWKASLITASGLTGWQVPSLAFCL